MIKSKTFITFFLLLSLTLLSNSLETQQTSKPKEDIAQPDQIIEIFRHGARGPLYGYDPTWNASDYGALTPVGMRQHYILGKFLAQKYSHLLGDPYDPNQIYMLSDVTPRCIQSALSHFYGMYAGSGPELREGFPSNHAIPPFRDPQIHEIAKEIKGSEALPFHNTATIVNIVEEKQTYLFKNNGPECPNGAIWEKQNLNQFGGDEGYALFNYTVKNLNQRLKGSGYNITGLKELKSFTESIMVDLADNRTLPYGIGDDKALVNNITYAYGFAAYQIWGAQEVQRQVYSFGLIDSILKQLEAFKTGKNYSKAALYSGHDGNLFSVLAAFGVLNTKCLMKNWDASLKAQPLPYPNCTYPTFASNIIVEFYNETGNPHVKILYNNQVLRLCYGQETCSYEYFKILAKSATGFITLESYPKKCGVVNPPTLVSQNVNNIPEVIIIQQSGTWYHNIALFVLTVLCLALVGDKVNVKRKLWRNVKENHGEHSQVSQMNLSYHQF